MSKQMIFVNLDIQQFVIMIWCWIIGNAFNIGLWITLFPLLHLKARVPPPGAAGNSCQTWNKGSRKPKRLGHCVQFCAHTKDHLQRHKWSCILLKPKRVNHCRAKQKNTPHFAQGFQLKVPWGMNPTYTHSGDYSKCWTSSLPFGYPVANHHQLKT